MKRLFLRLYILITAFVMMACESEEIHAASPMGNTLDNGGDNKTLIVYYSYTNATEQIVSDLFTLIDADVIEVEPAEKGLNYSANNYKIGTDQLNKINANPNAESSYPAIDEVSVDMSKYNTIIIATPLWWSQMASNMQTFLFKYGPEMAGKNVGLIVKSASSTIGGVESDAMRLVPDGKFMSTSLWIKDSNYSNRKSLLDQWFKDVNYNNATGLKDISANKTTAIGIYAINGQRLIEAPAKGLYIENGVKKIR